MIMKRKNIILSTILSFVILVSSSCADDYSTSFIVTSENSTGVSTTTTVEETEITTSTAATTSGDTSTETEFSAETQDVTETSDVKTEEITTTSATVEETTTTAEETTTTQMTETKTTTSEVTQMTNEQITEKKYIALTFDDGPNTTTTNEVLDVLEQYGIKGSFFLIGTNINSESEKSVKRAYDMGCDIGNHSKSHPYMNELSVDEIKAEIEYVDDYIFKITGEKP